MPVELGEIVLQMFGLPSLPGVISNPLPLKLSGDCFCGIKQRLALPDLATANATSSVKLYQIGMRSPYRNDD